MSDVAVDIRYRILESIDSRECPVDECGRTIRRGHALCYGCWRDVPTDLKRNVRYASGRSLDEWLDAMCAAVHAVEVKP